MELKRVYDIPEGWVKVVNDKIPLVVDGKPVLHEGFPVMVLRSPGRAEGECLNPPPVKGVEILHAGERQKFSPELIERGSAEGWLLMSKGKIVITGTNQTVTYKIDRAPGYYCCHCGEAVSDGNAAKAHISAKHSGKASPDKNNPAGYERLNAFDCTKE